MLLFFSFCSHQTSDTIQATVTCDDTAIVGRVSKGNDQEYWEVIVNFVDWYELNPLHINASKSKEMVVDFRRKAPQITLLNIQGLDTEMVGTYKYLGVQIFRFRIRQAVPPHPIQVSPSLPK